MSHRSIEYTNVPGPREFSIWFSCSFFPSSTFIFYTLILTQNIHVQSRPLTVDTNSVAEILLGSTADPIVSLSLSPAPCEPVIFIRLRYKWSDLMLDTFSHGMDDFWFVEQIRRKSNPNAIAQHNRSQTLIQLLRIPFFVWLSHRSGVWMISEGNASIYYHM